MKGLLRPSEIRATEIMRKDFLMTFGDVKRDYEEQPKDEKDWDEKKSFKLEFKY